MRRRIEPHRSPGRLRLGRLHHGELVGRILVSDCEDACSARRERETGRRVEAVPVDAISDREVCDRLTGTAIDHHHPAIAGTQEQMILRVERQAGRSFAAGQRPRRAQLVGAGVDHGNRALVLDVDVDPARSGVFDRLLELSTDYDRRDDAS